MLSGFLKAGQYDRVRGAFNDMLSCGLPPSVVTYNTLLAAQASQGDWCAAIDTLARVLASQADGVNANTTTCERPPQPLGTLRYTCACPRVRIWPQRGRRGDAAHLQARRT